MDLKEVRKKYRYSLSEFAGKCKIPISTFWKYENKIHFVDEKRAERIFLQLQEIGVTEEEIEEVKKNLNKERNKEKYNQ